MKDIIRVSFATFLSLLANRNNGSVLRVSIVRYSDPAERKPDKGRIVRITRGQIIIGANLDKKRAKLGMDPAGPRKWGVMVDPKNRVVEHNGKVYFSSQKYTKQDYGATASVRLRNSYQTVNGTPLVEGHELVQSIVFNDKNGNLLAKYAKQQPELPYRDYRIDDASYLRATIDGQTYDCTPNQE